MLGFAMEHESLKKAVKIMGSQTALGKAIGKSQAHVWAWLHRDKRAPAEQVIAIEKVSGVPRYELRPDIYPPEEYRKAS